MPTTIAIVDDHRLFLEALVDLVRKFDGYEVLYVAKNGRDLLEQIHQSYQVPDLALVDLHMPVMDGFETTAQLRQLYPAVRVLILTISDRKEDRVHAVRQGAQGYLYKGLPPDQIRRAMDTIMTEGFYFPSLPTVVRNGQQSQSTKQGQTSTFNLTEQELEFLRLACSQLTYQEIANRMAISLPTMDMCRASVFTKLNVRTRVDMVLKGIGHGLID